MIWYDPKLIGFDAISACDRWMSLYAPSVERTAEAAYHVWAMDHWRSDAVSNGLHAWSISRHASSSRVFCSLQRRAVLLYGVALRSLSSQLFLYQRRLCFSQWPSLSLCQQPLAGLPGHAAPLHVVSHLVRESALPVYWPWSTSKRSPFTVQCRISLLRWPVCRLSVRLFVIFVNVGQLSAVGNIGRYSTLLSVVG